MKALICMLAVTVLAAGCGNDDTDAASATPTPAPTATPVPTPSPTDDQRYPIATLNFDLGGSEVGDISFTITCLGDTATRTGDMDASGETIGDVAADEMCVALAEPEVQQRLIEGEPANQGCTEIYGSDDTAHVTGTLDEDPVNTDFHRNNGCGMHDWDTVMAEILPRVVGGPSPEPTPEPTVLRPCPRPASDDGSTTPRLYADLDGDDSAEVVLVERPEGSTTIVTVCDSFTIDVDPWDVGDANKPATVQVLDVQGDGRDELLVGGPTGAGPFAGSVVAVNVDGFEAGDVGVAVRPPVEGSPGESFACTDVDEDGLAELVAISYEFVGGTRIDDSSALTWTTSVGIGGEMTLPDEALDAWVLTSGTCGNAVTHPFGPGPVTAMLSADFDPSALARLAEPDELVALGLGGELIVDRTGAELADPDGWIIEREEYDGYSGPFSPLQQVTSAVNRGQPIQVALGAHDHCANPPLDPPDPVAHLTQVHIQPLGTDSCLQWFAVNLFIEDDLEVKAITLDLFGP